VRANCIAIGIVASWGGRALTPAVAAVIVNENIEAEGSVIRNPIRLRTVIRKYTGKYRRKEKRRKEKKTIAN
jgi:hypothetical protein